MYHSWCRLLIAATMLFSLQYAQAEVANTRGTPSVVREALQEIADANSDVVHLETFGYDYDENALVWVTLGKGENIHSRPALLLVAGIEPMDITGPDVMAGIVSSFLVKRTLNNDNILDSVTVYVVPYLSASSLQTVRDTPIRMAKGALTPQDDDKDGRMDEDPGNDMNNDGIVGYLRVANSSGAFVEHALESTVMVPYTPGAEGTRYDVFVEGNDDDDDGKLNEDVRGAINLNTNNPHNYPAYQEYAGAWSMTATELRQFTDKVFSRPNIIAAYVLGTYDNIVSNWNVVAKRNPRGSNILSTDSAAYEAVRGALASVNPYTNPGSPSGDLGSWLAYGVGPVTMQAPAYVFPALAKDSTKEKTQDPLILGARWLREYEPESVYKWTPIEHPFFHEPVEIGGINEWSLRNAPVDSINAATEKHYTLIREFCELMPRVEVTHSVQNLGAGMYRVRLTLHNNGTLPSHTTVGSRVKMHKSIVLTLGTDSGMEIVQGVKKTVDGQPITGGSSRDYEWIVKGGGELNVDIFSPSFGSAAVTISMSGGR